MPISRAIARLGPTSRLFTIRLVQSTTQPSPLRCYSSAPATIVDSGFWRSLVPRFLRKENRQQLKAKRSKDWNPATFFIVIFLFIGSMSIQMITLRNSFDRYMRQADVRIGLLREVVEKIQRGEAVDVEKTLGTGEPKKEADWEEVLLAIERDDAAKKAARRSKALLEAERKNAAQAATKTETETDKVPEAQSSVTQSKIKNVGSFF